MDSESIESETVWLGVSEWVRIDTFLRTLFVSCYTHTYTYTHTQSRSTVSFLSFERHRPPGARTKDGDVGAIASKNCINTTPIASRLLFPLSLFNAHFNIAHCASHIRYIVRAVSLLFLCFVHGPLFLPCNFYTVSLPLKRTSYHHC